MASAFPKIANFTFAIAEPTVLFLAFAVTSCAPEYYVMAQAPSTISHSMLPTERVIIYQLSNLFLLVAVIGIYVLNSTADLAVAEAYLSALWWGDLGHLGVTSWCMGWEKLCNVSHWTLVNWANIGVPLGLFMLRNLYFLGLL